METTPATEPVADETSDAGIPTGDPAIEVTAVENVAAHAPVAEPPTRARRTAAHAIAEHLSAAGARFAFTVPGESFLGVLDALPDAGIRVVATRHENGASFMAEAATQLSGKPQLCLGTRAVGAANLAIGIHTARADSAPMIALLGQVPRRLRGRDAFQEADLVGSIGRLAKWAVEIDDPARADALTIEALRRALSGRPGPVVISIPEEVADAETAASGSPTPLPKPQVADPDGVRAAMKLLAGSRRGAIVAGAGVLRANASRRLMRLAEALGVPVFASWRRPDAFPNAHPLYLGMCGIAAAPTVLPRLLEADVLLVIGSRLNEMTSFGYRMPGEGTRWVHVDADPDETHSGRHAPAISLASDAGRFVDAALSLLRGAAIDAENRSARLRATAADREAYIAASSASAEGDWDGPGVHPGRVVSTVGKMVAPETIITTDAGNFGGWLARGYRFRRPGTFVGPTSGAMGYGFPAAIAAALMYPRRQVVAFTGDGGFAMSMSEVETAVREGVAPIALVFDNRRYGTIAMHQEREGRMPIATDLGPVDFAGIARAQGAMGVSVTHDDQVGDALAEALASGRPAVIQLELDPRWVSVDQPASNGVGRESRALARVVTPAAGPPADAGVDAPTEPAVAALGEAGAVDPAEEPAVPVEMAPAAEPVESASSPMSTDMARAP